MIRLSAAIMAHPKRRTMVAKLRRELDRPVPVVWDQINDRHDTGIRAMLAYDPEATHHLVIQDDVQPCRDLLATVERALAHVPDGHPMSLYVGRVQPFAGKVNQAVRLAGDDSAWIVMDGCYWGPGIVVPTAEIAPMAEWWNGAGARHINYDRRVSMWFEARKIRTWYTWPSLVEHRGDKSLIRGGKAIRHAHRFLGADVSGLTVDWSGPVAEMTRTRQLDRRRQQLASRK